MSVRECARCSFIKDNEEQCKLRSCVSGSLCWIHTRRQYHLRVKPSTIPNAGRGLFAATADFRKGQQIVPYSGDVLTRAQYEQRYPNDDGEYVFKVNNNRYIDARSTQSAVGRYANRCTGTGLPCNARITGAQHPNLKATRLIHDGDEILVPYGGSFIQHQQQPPPRDQQQPQHRVSQRRPAAGGGGSSKTPQRATQRATPQRATPQRATPQRAPVPPYTPNLAAPNLMLCAGMNFSHPCSAVPLHTDDVRLRMLAHILPPGWRVKSLGSQQQDTPVHKEADVRQLHLKRSSARQEVQQCKVFILDSYFLPQIYFEATSNRNGYGDKWFQPGCQVETLLNANCKAVLLPNDRRGMVWALYQKDKVRLEQQYGIHAVRCGSRHCPLAVATQRAETETNWLQLKPNDAVYNRTHEQQAELYLNPKHGFICVFKGPTIETLPWLTGLAHGRSV